MKRIIERTKPKQHILQMLIRDFFGSTDCDKAVIEIMEDKDSRSTKQNRLYWEWIGTVISPELGYTKDEAHMILRDKFLGYNEITTKKGETIRELRST